MFLKRPKINQVISIRMSENIG